VVDVVGVVGDNEREGSIGTWVQIKCNQIFI
jgi:hypothetical protein